MAILTPSVIARESLLLLSNNTVAATLVYKGDNTAFSGARVGDTVTVRAPATFRVDEFAGSVNSQTINEQSVALKLEKHFDITVEVGSKQATLELADFSTQVIEPAMVAMAEYIDTYLYSKYVQINNIVSAATPGALATVGDLAQVDKQLMVQKVPTAGRVGFLSPSTKARFLSIDNIQRLDTRGPAGMAAMTEAALGRVMNIDWYGAQAVPTHTRGTPAVGAGAVASFTFVASPTALLQNDSNQSVLNITGTMAASVKFKAGDIVTIAALPGQSFVVVADATMSATINTGGQVTVAPALPSTVTSSAITVQADHAANIVGHPRGISLVSVPLELPFETEGENMAAILNWNGFNIRVVRKYDYNSKKNLISFDCIVGAKVTDPRLFTRFNG